MGEKYNSFGKDIKRISRAPATAPSTLTKTPNANPAKPVGFNELQGSSINLSDKFANKKLPSNMIVEKHSRIRIANPTITQVGLDLSLMGRKMIGLNRIRTAIIMKETDSDWTTVGVIYRYVIFEQAGLMEQGAHETYNVPPQFFGGKQ